jgi:hypothetical protein
MGVGIGPFAMNHHVMRGGGEGERKREDEAEAEYL